MQPQENHAESPEAMTGTEVGKPLIPHSPAPQYSSEQLFQGHRELLILHCGETYRLKLTRNGKLILNK